MRVTVYDFCLSCLIEAFFLVNNFWAGVIFKLWKMAGGKKKEVKKETGLGLSFKKEENFGEWYSEVSESLVYSVQ